ncbi:hypothetical protein EsDP_00001861 [Epichloe bromicola]|uniref:Uncharacterized protein n=1 Tax=Epichloe bromicola TaxID=79588 RepID=A0ABQ0CJ38_9HYPO
MASLKPSLLLSLPRLRPDADADADADVLGMGIPEAVPAPRGEWIETLVGGERPFAWEEVVAVAAFADTARGAEAPCE